MASAATPDYSDGAPESFRGAQTPAEAVLPVSPAPGLAVAAIGDAGAGVSTNRLTASPCSSGSSQLRPSSSPRSGAHACPQRIGSLASSTSGSDRPSTRLRSPTLGSKPSSAHGTTATWRTSRGWTRTGSTSSKPEACRVKSGASWSQSKKQGRRFRNREMDTFPVQDVSVLCPRPNLRD